MHALATILFLTSFIASFQANDPRATLPQQETPAAPTAPNDKKVAQYVGSFLAIKDLLDTINKTFVSTASKEKKEKIRRQIEFLRGDMVDVLKEKRGLFACADRNGGCADIRERVSRLRGEFTSLQNRVKELDQLCQNKYEKATRDVVSDLTTDLNEKQSDLDDVMQDLTGEKKYNKKGLKVKQKKMEKIAVKCIDDIDRMLLKMKE